MSDERQMLTEESSRFFFERTGCPFCGTQSSTVLSHIRYHETAEANKMLPDISGMLYACEPCGVAYSSHGCHLHAFPDFYSKALGDLTYFDESFLQLMRRRYLKEILRNRHKPSSLSRFLDAASLYVFQVPLVMREMRKQKILDVGCGFGEFMEAYRDMGNAVTGTEVIPALVQRLTQKRLDCELGEIEELSLEKHAFDVIIARAVFYRTRHPAATLNLFKELLAEGGELAFVDPYPTREGVEYFFKKQFPQGHFYILDHQRYLAMLKEKFGLSCVAMRQVYGRPGAPLKKVRLWGNVVGLFELFCANLFKRKPYVMGYTLKISEQKP